MVCLRHLPHKSFVTPWRACRQNHDRFDAVSRTAAGVHSSIGIEGGDHLKALGYEESLVLRGPGYFGANDNDARGCGLRAHRPRPSKCGPARMRAADPKAAAVVMYFNLSHYQARSPGDNAPIYSEL